jgi:hypothetical protein
MQQLLLYPSHLEIHTTRQKVGTNENPDVALSKMLDGFVSLRDGEKRVDGIEAGKIRLPSSVICRGS